jgi:hypothetical protein
MKRGPLLRLLQSKIACTYALPHPAGHAAATVTIVVRVTDTELVHRRLDNACFERGLESWRARHPETVTAMDAVLEATVETKCGDVE